MIYTHVSNKDPSQIKSLLDRLFENKRGGGWSKRMIWERFGEEKFSSRRMHIRSSYIPPSWKDMRSIMDIPKLYTQFLPEA